MAPTRRAVHAYLTPQGHEVWHRVSREAGVSLSALLEALAADMAVNPPGEGNHPQWEQIVSSARLIDTQRRRRGTGD